MEKSKTLKELQELESSEEKEDNEEKEEVKEDLNENPMSKAKKPRSQKQIETFEKARTKMLENNKLRIQSRKQFEEESKKTFEGKVVKKALEIKKKQIIREALLDDISDDETDTPLEKIKTIIKKKTIKKELPSAYVPSVIYV